MTIVQFLTSKEYGCCTTAELMALNREDKAGFALLKQWARDEMTARGIPISDPAIK